MSTKDMEDSHFTQEEEVRQLHIIMGDSHTESNRYRSRVGPIELVETMRSLQKEVKRYQADTKRIMKAQEMILQSLNMLQNQVKKYSGTKKASSVGHATTSTSYERRDDPIGSRQLRSVSRKIQQHHHFLGHSTKRTHERSRSMGNPSSSLFRHKKIRHVPDVLQGDRRNLKPKTFVGEHRKGE